MNIWDNLLLVLKRVFKKGSVHEKGFIYVAIGDSTVEGIGASTPERSFAGIVQKAITMRYKNTLFYNLGKGGARVEDVVASQLDEAIRLQPDLITISIGANDMRKRTNLEVFESALILLLKKLREETHAEIVINNIPDLSLAPVVKPYFRHISKFLLHRYNQKINDQAHKANCILVDLFSQSKVYAKVYPEAVSSDGFHPSDFGYALWANTIINHIQHILFKDNYINITAKN